MGLINFPQAPTVSSIYAPKDSVAQLNYMNQSNVQGLSNLLNLGSKIHDYALSREQANLMEQPGGNEDQKMREIASIESRKINSSDPSMIWRWKTQLDQQASEAEKNRLASAAASSKISQDDIRNFGYKVDMLVNRTNPANTGDKTRQIIDLENAILEGQKLGADVTRLVEKKKAVENSLIGEDSGDFSGGTTAENLKANVEDFVNSKPSTAQIDEFVKKHTNLGNDEQKMIKAARREAVDREEKEYKAAVLKKAKSLNTSGLDWEDLKEEEQKKLMAKAKAALAK
jgi:hypothetical protein